jgi:hypothetical protein
MRRFIAKLILGELAFILLFLVVAQFSPVLAVAIFGGICTVVWLVWIEPFGHSIARDVFAHMHEIDD